MKNRFPNAQTFVLVLTFFLFLVSGCGWSDRGSDTAASGLPRKVEGYSFKGLKFSYYLVDQGLSRQKLLALAAEIHEKEPDTHLIFVDDLSGLREYVDYAKAISTGRRDVDMPQEWAEKHVVANLQMFTGGKWVLNKGYGYEEIGEVP